MKLMYPPPAFLFLIIFLSLIFSFGLKIPIAYAVVDGQGNDILPWNVGIGTTTPQGALVVTRGNVGIGTWAPIQALDVIGNITASGTITGATIIGTLNPTSLEVTGQTTLNTSSGNTGIGTTLTGGNTARLAVIGGNVGIGTIKPQGAFVVTNGNVGIGTWTAAGGNLIIRGSGGVSSVGNSYIKIAGSGGAVVIDNAVTQVAAGSDGQELVLYGTSDTNTVMFHDGDGLKLSSSVSFTMGNNTCLRLIYNSTGSFWREVSRGAN